MATTRRSFPAISAAGVLGLLRPASAEALGPPPKLLIVLVSYQFRTDYLEAVRTHLSAGGFRRLMEQGSYFPDCHCAASTFTASGLATLATGAYPSAHGVIADRWYDRAQARAVEAAADHLVGSTLAREMTSAPGMRVFGFGTDEAHLRLFTGRSGNMLLASNGRGQVVGQGETPAWLGEYNRLHPIENVHDARWMNLGAGAGVPPLRTLTYDAQRPEDFYALYNSSPFAQAAQFEFVREWMGRERMGQGETTDCLLVTLAPMALLGYEVGAESPLMAQMVLQLDREIELTLETLNRTVGAGNFSFLFTAAHGAPAASPRVQETAVPGETVARALERALSARFDTPPARTPYMAKYIYPFVYLREEALRRHTRELRSAAAAATLALPQVAGFYTADGECSHTGEWRRRFRNSFHAGRSGDVMLAYRPFYVEDYGAGRGISYGSLYNYDTRVPLMFYGPQFRSHVFESRVETIDVAPTLARALGVPPPSSSVGRVLGETFAGKKKNE